MARNRGMSQDPFYRALDMAERRLSDDYPNLEQLRLSRVAEKARLLGDMTMEEAEKAYRDAPDAELTAEEIESIVRRVVGRSMGNETTD